jgi:arabinan endo-1,5-alpha-L-arabinosidase
MVEHRPIPRGSAMTTRNARVSAVLVVLVLAAGVAWWWPATDPDTYVNPVFEPVLADPSVLRAADGTYYAYGTEDDWGDGDGPRAIPILRSEDLVTWEYVGEAFDRRPDWMEGDLWAPDVTRIGDRYYLLYSLAPPDDPDAGIGVAVADDPAGPFEDLGQLIDGPRLGVENSLYPQLVVDTGTPYLLWGSFHGIFAIELEPDLRRSRGEPTLLAGTAFEAPYVIERDGVYWLLLSLGTCCEGLTSTYRVAVGRSEALLGPYVDRDGRDLRESRGTLLLWESDRFIALGQAAVATDDADETWLLYHAIDPSRPVLDSGATRRPLMLDPLRWDDDGWPYVADVQPSDARQPVPRIERD